MAQAKQNVTLVIEEDLLLSARKIALERRTSVNQLVREFLATLIKEVETRSVARQRLKMAFDRGLVEIGDKRWSREDLYER